MSREQLQQSSKSPAWVEAIKLAVTSDSLFLPLAQSPTLWQKSPLRAERKGGGGGGDWPGQESLGVEVWWICMTSGAHSLLSQGSGGLLCEMRKLP